MPEPNTLSHVSPDPEPPLEDGKTLGWLPPSKPSPSELNPTYTREALFSRRGNIPISHAHRRHGTPAAGIL